MSTGAASTAAAIPFPLVAPQFTTLAAGPLAGQQVLCLPDSVFVDKKMDGDWVKRFAMTGLVTHEQFGRFAASVQGKVFWRDTRPKGATVVGNNFRDAVAKGIRAAFEYRAPSAAFESPAPNAAEVAEASLRTLVDPVHQASPGVLTHSALEVGPFRLFSIPPFDHSAESAEKPVFVLLLYAQAYAAAMGGRLPTSKELGFLRRVAGDLVKTEEGNCFRMVLSDDPLRLLNLLPFAFDRSTLPFPEVFVDDVLDGYHGILYGGANGPAIVGEAGASLDRLNEELRLWEKLGSPGLGYYFSNRLEDGVDGYA